MVEVVLSEGQLACLKAAVTVGSEELFGARSQRTHWQRALQFRKVCRQVQA